MTSLGLHYLSGGPAGVTFRARVVAERSKAATPAIQQDGGGCGRAGPCGGTVRRQDEPAGASERGES